MRLWQLFLGVGLLAVMLSIARDPAGRVAMVVFFTMLGEVALGTTAVMMLFQTFSSLGEAKGLYEHAEAVFATTIVLAFGTALMAGLLFIGCWLVVLSVD
ncbi:MAG: hypothetical protein P4L84_35260 [Isosphaeraceae bacterium]|nr:hypothetical protein [Isosphaeraceae bacterium]